MVTLKPESVSRKNVIFGSHKVHCTIKMFFPQSIGDQALKLISSITLFVIMRSLVNWQAAIWEAGAGMPS